jgi:hypothetical protein
MRSQGCSQNVWALVTRWSGVSYICAYNQGYSRWICMKNVPRSQHIEGKGGSMIMGCRNHSRFPKPELGETESVRDI